ncbi:hypothetical protein F5Y05DRAFT_409817 [Hypoxylon sp. FL0543]|nr:hypothetical protein F5Y05DRAFT_409817 [Hypoxylon sp. FL0543]
MLFSKLTVATLLTGALAAPVTNEEAVTRREPATATEDNTYTPLIYARPKEQTRDEDASYSPLIYARPKEEEKRDEDASYSPLIYARPTEEKREEAEEEDDGEIVVDTTVRPLF